MALGKGIRETIAKRAAKEIEAGMIVNLGIGIPSLVPNYISRTENVMFHTENGILGVGETPKAGEEDENLCNAAGLPVTVKNGAAFFDSALAFAMIRRGCIDISILGALQVSEKGDLANWIVPGARVPGIGGAMELAEKSKKVIIVMSQLDKHHQPKIVKECTLPLTAKQCVSMIITEMAVFTVSKEGLSLAEIFDPFTKEDVQERTGAPLK